MKVLLPLIIIVYSSFLFGQSAEERLFELEPIATRTVDGRIPISLTYDSTSVLRNPLNGWVMYAGRTAEPTYWDKEYYVDELQKFVKVIDYASACYVRTSWSSLNPKEGIYTWRDTTTQIGRLIQGAMKRGVPIAFRIVVDGRDQGMNTPKFVFDAGARYYMENDKHPNRLTPLPQDPIFQRYYERFIKAFAKDFNDPERVAFIDAYGLGKWGEAHNVVYAETGEATEEEVQQWKEEVFGWVTDVYTKYFTKVPLIINYHRLVGHPQSWGDPNPKSEELLEKAIAKGYGLRQDAFGMTEYYAGWEEDFAAKWRYKRPIIMEGGWITAGQHRYWIDPSKRYRQGHPEDVRQGEFDIAAAAHVNMMDFRAGDTDSWFEYAFPLVKQFTAEGGYRLYPEEIVLPKVINNKGLVHISHRWQNKGWGYFPNNIPQWNYKYKVAFALLDENGLAKQVFVDDNCEPSDWRQGVSVIYDYKAQLNVSKGRYSWGLAIVDRTKADQPAIQLAIDGVLTSEGWLKLQDVEVQ
ncbi:DUF4832 domain-containing protein [Sphingobacterium arenae]|uniref:DUF4832 domain-containing protein n=1 Tax=Sphingobacterium arenae TaxID=1280598 RepID=A0ABR7Y8U7_9SPHI|nr:DUF4832 domain-containing protein [Sphingobacterium arenae]MBD1427710.1 DUF4832 domain-containing protein [Sphingobacterium arenae]